MAYTLVHDKPSSLESRRRPMQMGRWNDVDDVGMRMSRGSSAALPGHVTVLSTSSACPPRDRSSLWKQ